MTRAIRPRFDGRVFVLLEPIDLPANHPVTVSADVQQAARPGNVADRKEALMRFLAEPLHGTELPDWAMEREHLYDDRD